MAERQDNPPQPDVPAKPQAAGTAASIRPFGPVVILASLPAGLLLAILGHGLDPDIFGYSLRSHDLGRNFCLMGGLLGTAAGMGWGWLLARVVARHGSGPDMLLGASSALGAGLWTAAAAVLVAAAWVQRGMVHAPSNQALLGVAFAVPLGTWWGLTCGAVWYVVLTCVAKRASSSRSTDARPAAQPGRDRRDAVTAIACLLCGGAGAHYGEMAGAYYGTVQLGICVGYLVSALVAVMWAGHMNDLRRWLLGRPYLALPVGTALGVVAGVVATLGLHGTLALGTGKGTFIMDRSIVTFGMPVGLVVGVVCSVVWYVLAGRRPARQDRARGDTMELDQDSHSP
jgi:hypothetical protein